MSDENKDIPFNEVSYGCLGFKVLAVSNASHPFSSLIQAITQAFDTCLIKPDHNQLELKLANWQPNCVFVDLDYVNDIFANQLISNAGRFGVKVFVHDREEDEGVLYQNHGDSEVECISKFMATSDVINKLSAMAAKLYGTDHHDIPAVQVHKLEEIYHQIARELHDELGSLLSTMRLKLDSMYGMLGADGMGKESLQMQLNDLDHIVFEAITSVKKISARHRQPYFELDLLTQVDKLIKTLDITVYKQVTSHAMKQIDAIDKARLFQVYRIIQEALNNVQYHSKAKEASVKFDGHQSALFIEVIDQGVGFTLDHVTNENSSFGLLGMYERADRIHAKLSISSAPGEGTHVKLEVPIDKSGSN